LILDDKVKFNSLILLIHFGDSMILNNFLHISEGPNSKVFTLNSHKPWWLKPLYLLFFVVPIAMSLCLPGLMIKNDAEPIMWTSPVEPPGSVIVTRNSFAPAQPHLARSQQVDVAAVKVSVGEGWDATKNHAPATEATSEDLIAALKLWSDAWSRRDMGSYLGAYAPSFVPELGSSREAWAKQRTARITAKQNIRHEVRDVDVQIKHNKAIVKFTQVYVDERLQQTDQKTMHWVLSDDRWLIAREVVR